MNAETKKRLYKVYSAIDDKPCGLVYLDVYEMALLRDARHLEVVLYLDVFAALESGMFPPSEKTLTLRWDDDKERIITHEPGLVCDLLVRQLQSMERLKWND